jgi:hypothetical protein
MLGSQVTGNQLALALDLRDKRRAQVQFQITQESHMKSIIKRTQIYYRGSMQNS